MRNRKSRCCFRGVVVAAVFRFGAGVWIALALTSFSTPILAKELYVFPEIFSTENNPLKVLGPPSINVSGRVAFRADFPKFSDPDVRTIMRGRVGSVEILAANNDPIRVFIGDPSINDSDDVAFVLIENSLKYSILRFTSATNSVTTIAESGATFDSLDGVSLNNAGSVAFWGTSADDSQELIAAANGASTVFVDAAPSAAIRNLKLPVINRAGPAFEVAYAVVGPGPAAVIKGNSLTKTTIAEVGPTFSTVEEIVSISDAGVVGFVATPVGGLSTVYTGTGGSPAFVANTSAEYDSFDAVAVSNAGVAFLAKLDLSGVRGVFTGPHVIDDKVLREGDSIPGYPSTVKSVELGPEAMNDNGQIALHVGFEDGTNRILRADPIGDLHLVHESDRAVAALKTDTFSSISQALSTPQGDELLEFDYFFATTGGELTVSLEDEVLARIPARDQLADGFAHIKIPVDVHALFPVPPDELLLKFTLAGTGETSGMLIDNVRFGDIENGDFGRGSLFGWQSEYGDDGGVGVAVSPFAVAEPVGMLMALIAAAAAPLCQARRRSAALIARC
jgi:hypothetical protein